MADAEDETGRVVALMGRGQRGDKAALAELQAIGGRGGGSYIEGWSGYLLLLRLQDRAHPRNLLARAAVADDLEAVAGDLADRRDGAIERLIVGRAALCAVDAGLADLEHVASMLDGSEPAT